MSLLSPRDEIRAAGITCPSCGLNATDMPKGHRLALVSGEPDHMLTAECRDGQKADLDDFDGLRMAMNMSLLDGIVAEFGVPVTEVPLGLLALIPEGP